MAVKSGPYTTATKVGDVMGDPAFGNYGRLIFPANTSYWSGNALENLRLTWYNGIDPGKTVEICNYLKDHAYPGLPHGFGLGAGTVAEGWLNDAVAFWEGQM